MIVVWVAIGIAGFVALVVGVASFDTRRYVGMIRLIEVEFRVFDVDRRIVPNGNIYPGSSAVEVHLKLAIPEHLPARSFDISLKLLRPGGEPHGVYHLLPCFFSSTHVMAQFLLPVEQMLCKPGNWIVEVFLPETGGRLGGWYIPVPKCMEIKDDLRTVRACIVSLKDGVHEESDIVHGVVDDVLFVAKFEPKVYPVSKFAGVTVKAKLTRIVDNFATYSGDTPLLLQGTSLLASISVGHVKQNEGDWQVECLIGERVLATHRFRVVTPLTALNAITVDSLSLNAETTSGKFIPVNDTICFASETLNVIPVLILNVPYPSGFASYTVSMKVFRDEDVAGEWTHEAALRSKVSECALSKIPIPEPKSKDKPADYKVCFYLDERLIVRTGFRVRPRPPELPHIRRLLLNGDLDAANKIAPTSDRQLNDAQQEGKKTPRRRRKAS